MRQGQRCGKWVFGDLGAGSAGPVGFKDSIPGQVGYSTFHLCGGLGVNNRGLFQRGGTGFGADIGIFYQFRGFQVQGGPIGPRVFKGAGIRNHF